MPNASDRTALLLCALISAPVAAAPFDQSLELQDVSFHVQCPNQGSINTVTITPSGLQADNSAITREADGVVTGAEVADLNADGSPEVYVYTQSAGSGSYGDLIAYAANRGQALSEITLPAIADDPDAAPGYMGHDTFAVVGDKLVRRFPVYRDGDTNAQPSGGMRQIQYRLVPGESGWMLRKERIAAD